ncbi:MAG: acyl-CoA carboxylase subunit beta, partial [Sneathiella sp.]|nr:acyl-CoA carboxylase subunit beta [Sneathiella sp.]
MPVIHSEIETSSDTFIGNRSAMLEMIGEFRGLEQKVRDTSNSKKEKFEKRGQLLPRERIALLLDKGAPFLQLATLAGLAMHDDDGINEVYGGGTIVGIGYVSGVRCMVTASDSAIKGGTIAPMGLEKTLRAQEIILKNKLPVINLIESGGANLLYQAEIFVKAGATFANQA